jgi:hypothetical protein
MASELEPLPVQVAPQARVESAAYIAGLIGLSIGFGFYGLIYVLLLTSWTLHAPNAPTVAESEAIYYAAIVHLIPLCLWVKCRSQISRFSNLWRWAISVCAWLLILASLTVMVRTLGV